MTQTQLKRFLDICSEENLKLVVTEIYSKLRCINESTMVDDICWHVVHAIHLALNYLVITAYYMSEQTRDYCSLS
jgi:hypothetical protein